MWNAPIFLTKKSYVSVLKSSLMKFAKSAYMFKRVPSLFQVGHAGKSFEVPSFGSRVLTKER